MSDEMMAACGLDCGSCRIFRAPFDPAAGKYLVDWFRKEGWIARSEGIREIIERKMYCRGCLGDRDTHWSADCWILACCVDGQGLDNCSQCDSFPCDRLVDWSRENEGYKAALARLKASRASAGPG